MRPPILAAGFVVVLVSIVAIGLSGRLGAGAFPAGPENAAVLPSTSPAPSPTTAVSLAPLGAGPSSMPAFPADTGPIYTSAPGPMAVQAKRHPQTIFAHLDVDAARITWVFVSVQDEIGRVAGWTSVSVPGAAGPNTNGGPALRFDVELALPDDFTGPLWVRAQAYDLDGKVVASANVEIPGPQKG
jgi:hypothetical protein